MGCPRFPTSPGLALQPGVTEESRSSGEISRRWGVRLPVNGVARESRARNRRRGCPRTPPEPAGGVENPVASPLAGTRQPQFVGVAGLVGGQTSCANRTQHGVMLLLRWPQVPPGRLYAPGSLATSVARRMISFGCDLGRREGLLLRCDETALCGRALRPHSGTCVNGKAIAHPQALPKRVGYKWLIKRI